MAARTKTLFPASWPRTWLYSPLGGEPLTGREAVLEAMRGVGAVAADLIYTEVLSGETHHAAYFRLQIEDTVVNGMDYLVLDADGKTAEVTIRWRPQPSGIQMQRHLVGLHAAMGTPYAQGVNVP